MNIRTSLLATLMSLLWLACEKTPVDPPPPPPVASDAGFGSDVALPIDASTMDAGWPDAMPLVDAGPETCQTPVALIQMQSAVLALETVVFYPEGGSGLFLFEFEDNQSGGILNPISGQYVSGPASGVTDRFKITDEVCGDVISFELPVVLPMDVRPAALSIPRGGVFTFEVYEGSGQFKFEKLTTGTTSTLTASGAYIASQTRVTDTIQVSDIETKEVVEVQITVVNGVSIQAQTNKIFLPMGHEHVLKVKGGSGWFDISSTSTVARITDSHRIHGDTPGRTQLTINDHFISGVSTTLDLDIVTVHTFTSTRGGDYLRESKTLAPGDINGDGFDDILVGIGDVDVSGHNGGAIFIYAGTASGLNLEPVQVLSAHRPESRMGFAFEVGHFDGDGQLDLLVGIGFAHHDLSARLGRVELYRGLANGFFESTPHQTWSGRNSYDYFGYAVTSCDFNGDGRLDFAAGAMAAEDRQAQPRFDDQGSIAIFLQRASGFLDVPDQVIYGKIPDGSGGFVGFRDLRLGLALASGDFNGDQVCDLIASTYRYRSPNGGTRNGLIYVYPGQQATMADNGGVAAEPAIGFRSGLSGQSNDYMGRRIMLADLNQDGKDDLIAGVHEYQSNGPRIGALLVFAGRSLTDTPLSDLIWSDQANYFIVGKNGGDRLGYALAVGDYDQDGVIDLMASTYQGESRGGPVNAGTIHVYRGQSGEWPSLVPTATIALGKSYDRFGAAFCLAGDLDRDGEMDLIAYSTESDFWGINAGGAVVVSGTTTPRADILQLRGWQPSGDRAGHGVAMLKDINGDGYTDMISGAPYADSRALSTTHGRGLIYLGGPGGISLDPAMVLSGFRRHGGGDQFGWRVADAGDFDQTLDPIVSNDIAMLARIEDYPSSFNATDYLLDGNCRTSAVSNSGAVLVWSGSASGMPDQVPDFMYFGPQAGQGLRNMIGGFNFNGDAYDDLAVSSQDWDNASLNTYNTGGLVLIAGRSADASGRTTVICDEALNVLGRGTNDYMGRAMASLGDLNGDGCDEIVVGAPREDAGRSDQGVVRVIFGFGGSGCPASAEMVAFASGVTGSRAGYSIAAGHDVDGDAIADIAVGGYNYSGPGRPATGAAWLISGAYVLSLPRIAVTTPVTAMNSHPFQTPISFIRNMVRGKIAGENFGAGVALIQTTARGTARMIVGSTYGAMSGTLRSGGAQVFEFQPGVGFDSRPVAIFSGESNNSWNELGRMMSTAYVGIKPTVVIGGINGTGPGIDLGSVYTLDLSGL